MAAKDTASVDVTKYGFDRPDMFTSSLSNTAVAYDRHVFLCYKNYGAWPAKIEESETDLLPKLFDSALKARKDDIKVKTRLTVFGGSDGTCSDGDVMIFPEMVKYRGLKESQVESFVDDVLVNEKPWESGVQEPLFGAFVFICAHTNRDKRCGVCGPILIEKFKEEIQSRDLTGQISVYACSHIGGHKYAGNMIIFGTSVEGKVTGDWFGYVTPSDIPDFIDQHIGRGIINEKLWRGQMGLYEKDTDKKDSEKVLEPKSEKTKENKSGCCRGAKGVSCCQNPPASVDGQAKGTCGPHGNKHMKGLPAWVGKWEQSDVLMATAAIGAVATIAVAYSFFRRSG